MSEDIAKYEHEATALTTTESPIGGGGTPGLLVTTTEEREKLYQPVNPEEVEIRPDGMVFLPWVFYHKRLAAAFGTEWALLPDGKPKMEGSLILWPFSLWQRLNPRISTATPCPKRGLTGDRVTVGKRGDVDHYMPGIHPSRLAEILTQQS